MSDKENLHHSGMASITRSKWSIAGEVANQEWMKHLIAVRETLPNYTFWLFVTS